MKQRKIPVLGTWLNYKKKTVTEWLDFFQKFINAGISEYFINGSANELKYLINVTKQLDINIHGWIWVMNRPNDPVAMKNPNWYSVNRKGESSFDFRPYVDYYQWLSPFSNGARSYVKKNILEIAKIEGIGSVHLDYVRYCDVIYHQIFKSIIELNKKVNCQSMILDIIKMPELDLKKNTE